jgi:leucyl/phenylalanyl-tRNA---protein transferase
MALWSLDASEIWFPYRNEMDGDRVAVGADLAWQRVLIGFVRGCFPYYQQGEEIAWYSPNARGVIFPHLLEETPCLKIQQRNDSFSFVWDQHFDEVLSGCRRWETDDTGWLHDDVFSMYQELYRQGFAHSLSVMQNDKVVGGIMGVAVGRVFFGLSMYHLVDDASKAGLCFLIQFLKEKKWKLLDCQWATPFLKQMGAVEMERDLFLDHIQKAFQFRTPRGNWSESRTWRQKDPFPKREDMPIAWH